ncbi:MAG: tripartite tricarboxylate transporter substrate binding protein [Hylemonella sp.]|uniref:tripartite tricarboxylate transporter substrate binding protein n=1 Tax=Hylemonella sp. TaxID=2066020 RepID=UPI0022C1D41F|nr:tripartite tricarboxylate transporter substrate binding protein [Hylemonella sp.]MCZ8253317.1 tripartite tricarboxylate transporter substrate binding protein [Hylemonella sp.]
MTLSRLFLQLSAAALTAAAAVLPAFAQDAYPSKPVTMLVPFPPGGVADTVGRPVAEAMARALGQPMVVENKGGAGGGIGMAQVAKSRADGYSVLMSLSSVVVLPEADKVLKRNPLYTLDQLKPIARFTADPTALVVRADSPWKTYQEFIAHVKSKPGSVTFGSSGNYGTMHVPMEQLKAATNTFMLHVPYTGAGPAVMALLGGQIDALSTGPSSVMQHVRAGKLRVLAHWGEGRLAALPEVPSLKELGVPVTYSQWSGLFVPAGTPEAAVAKLRAAAKAASEDPRARQSLTAAGTSFMYQDMPEFERFVQADAKAMAALVQRIGRVE